MKMNHSIHRRTHHRSRGAAMLLVLFAVAMAMVLGLSFINAQATSSAVAQNNVKLMRARAIAESGIEMAINYTQNNPNWRSEMANGLWLEEYAFGNGTADIYGEDEDDADLADDNTEPVTLTAIATYDGVSHKVRAVVIPGSDGGSGPVEFPIAITGTTYYVRTSGNDGNDGLAPSRAWLTLQKAANTMSPGDGVYIGAGTYALITTQQHGTTDDPIWFIADTDGSQTGDAGATIVTGGTDDPAIHVGHDFTRLIGLQITAGKSGARFVSCDGGVMANCETHDNTLQGIRVAGATLDIHNGVSHGNRNGIYITSGATVNLIDTTFRNNDHHGLNRWDGARCSITATRCQFYQNGRSGFHMSMKSGGNCAITNCLIVDNVRIGVNQTGNNGSTVTIWHCTIANNGERGVFLQSNSNCTVINSIIAFNDQGFQRNNGTMSHNYNIVYGNNTNFVGTVASDGDWQVDPQFVSIPFIGDRDYHLQPGSLAIDRGTDASAITTVDIEYGVRPTGAKFDKGCYEFGSVASGGSSPMRIIWDEQP